MKVMFTLFISIWLTGCLGMPASVEPVTPFDADKYLGTWYEIARLDHSFERGLSQVTAEYSMRDDGGISVINRGYSKEEGEWSEAQGKAYFVRGSDEGYLQVSFFGPFYGSYVVFELDQKNYEYAFISGPDHDYLWLLSRTPTVSDELKKQFEQLASQHGFETASLIYVDQDANQ